MALVRYAVTALACLLAICDGGVAMAAPLLNSLFQDHAVLQRDKPIHVWGQAEAGATVTVSVGGETAGAQADATGRWSAMLPALAAGGPYTLTASSAGASQTVNDVLIGDVWLCSGQSNMVLPVKAAIDSGADIGTSTNDKIRLLTIDNNTSPAPSDHLLSPVKWQAAGPKTVPDFSAACYFFGRDLQKSVDVPMGLVMSAWNGANITTFMSDDALHKIGGYDTGLDTLKVLASDPKAGVAQWGKVLESWWREHMPAKAGAEPWDPSYPTADWAEMPQALGDWQFWGVAAMAHFTGDVWFRTSVNLTTAQAAQAAELGLGGINEEDETWLNGAFIGNTFGYGAPRKYQLAAGMLHAGDNTIAVAVLCTWRGCGMLGPSSDMALRFADGSSVPLNVWHYEAVPASIGTAPRAPWGAVPGLGMAYNAMIAPLEPYGFRGVLWYQGESNTGQPKLYRAMLSGMMSDWRAKFGTDLPFLIVQLPDFGLPPVKPEESSWAELRESQRAAVADDKNAALAVTIDVGDHYGLHPATKQEVGRRLSLAARRLVYHQAGVATSPVATQAARVKGSIVVRFTDVDRGLVAYNANEPIGFELCGAAPDSCRFARARILGDNVWLAIPKGLAVTHVRYCWADGPVCTLFDGARLPAGPFDLPVGTGKAKRGAMHRAPRKHR